MTSDYGVDIYQLNVGQGDSAIYVQCKGNTALSMVLVDGGDGQSGKARKSKDIPSPWDNVKRTVERVRSDFRDLNLCFDAVIVTHWDSDHVQGVIEFIMADLQLGQEETPKREQCQFLKYGTTGNPQTVMYFPYWDSSKSNSKLSGLKGAERKTVTFGKYQDSRGNEAMEWYVSIKGGGFATVKDVNLVRYTPETMLGVDFFLNNQSPIGANFEGITSLEKLLAKETGVDANKPGLLCISTDRILLGQKKTFSAELDGNLRITGGATTNDNKVSIVTLVVWRPTREISYYAAGDMDDPFEDKIVQWTQVDSAKQVRVVKASHHGAAGSFPQDLIKTWKPKAIVFSQGAHYFHPAWEILYWISQELVYSSTSGPKPIWATAYPYWLTRDAGNNLVFEYQKDAKGWNKLASLTDQKYTNGLQRLDNLKKAADPSLVIVALQDQVNGAGTTQEKRAHWLLSILADKWDLLSNTTSDSTHFTGQSNSIGKPVTYDDQVWYISIQCRSDFTKTIVAEHRNKGATRKATGVTTYTLRREPPKPSKAATKRKAGGTKGRAAGTPQTAKKKRTRTLQLAKTTEEDVEEEKVSVPSTVISSATDSGFLIYAKQVDGETAAHYVVSAEYQRNFIEQLNREVLELEISFDVAGDNVPVNFQAEDEMYNWFQNSLTATSLSARGADGQADHFDMEVAFNSSYLLKFSTEAVPLQFKIEEPTTSPLSDKWGLLKQYPIMIFGLGAREPDFETTISEVYAFAGFTSRPWFDAKVKLRYPASGNSQSLFQRNAIWFMPSEGYSTAMRLTFRLTETDGLTGFLQGLLGKSFSLDEANVAVRKSCSYNLLEEGYWNASISSEIVLDYTGRIAGTEAKITSVLSDNEEDMDLILDFENASLANMLSWLNDLLNTTINLELPTDLTGDPSLRRIELGFESNKCIFAAVTFQLAFNFGAEGKDQVVFFLTYAWPQNQLMGSLYPGVDQDPYKILYPEYEPYRVLIPQVDNEDDLAEGLDLAHIIPSKVIPVPEHVLPTITSANVILGSGQFHFAGQLTWNSTDRFVLPIVQFDSINLAAMYNWNTSNVLLYLDVRAQLVPRHEELLSADLFGAIAYDGDSWSFEFVVNNLYLSTLYSFFDDDVKEGVMDMLELVEIDVLQMKYDYSSSGKSNRFLLAGTVVLGPIKASCEYSHELDGWTFYIGVGPNSPEATIGDVMRSIMGQNTFLPSCVDTIKIPTNANGDTFTIHVKKQNITGEDYVVFNGQCNLDVLRFSFVQLRRAGSGTSLATKRVFRIGVGRLPDADVPLIGTLPQVFDEMSFLWVDDSSQNGQGLTRKEVEIINSSVFEADPDNRIRFKETRTQASMQRPEDLVLQNGLHFIIALNQLGTSRVVLDHRFGGTRTSGSAFSSTALATRTGQNPTGSGETTMAPMEKKVGPLSISNIGLQFLDDVLYIVLDATFELGPLQMTLLGFGLGVRLSGEFNLLNLPGSLEVKLQGLAVGLEKRPLSLAGLFQYSPPLYQGGIIVGFIPYSFLAAGFYGDTGLYRTVFVFARLSGPLITLAFAEISGICGGFGYNNTIGFPTITQVPEYPFINNSNLGSNPADVLQALTGTGWVQPREDVNWFVAGMAVKAFGLLSVEAVVAVEINPYVKLGIFALAQAGFPLKATGSVRFLYVQLGISAVVDFEVGVMKIEGQLTPNSFILAPSCHLTGGFGLCYWFGDNDNAGDWVFTIGGYHPSFVRPSHYPEPPRLGISWKVDGALSITGESYFAITPKCCMAGIRLHAAMSLGPLGAWFLAQVNMLINFNPFYFQGDVSVSVGVSFTMYLFIITLRIKAEIGAMLYIRGPPFGGRVHVNFWVFGFNIDFGPDAKPPSAVSLGEFWQMCLQDGVQGSSRAVRAATQDHVLAVASGLLPTSSNSEMWDVRGSLFSFTIQGRFPIKTATVTGGGQVADNSSVYAKPMLLTQPIYASTMTIEITRQVARATRGEDRWLLTRVITNVPDALWGKYDRSQDPMASGNQIGNLLNPSSVKIPLTMSITVSSPKPVLAPDVIPKFNVVYAMAVDVNDASDRPGFPVYPDDIGSSLKPDEPEEGEAQWVKVRDAWSSDAAEEASRGALDAWFAAYGWDEEEKGGIFATPPKNALKSFLTVYIAAPLMCA